MALLFPIYLVGAVFALASLVAVGVGWRLSEGPVSVDFLTPYLQESLSGLPPDWSVGIGESFIDWDGEEQALRIRVKDVRVVNAERQRVVSIPEAVVDLRGDALIAGEIEPREIAAVDVSLLLTRGQDAAWRLGMGQPGQNVDGADPMPQRSVADLAVDLFGTASGQRQGILGRLERLVLRNTRVSVIDNLTGRVLQLQSRHIALRARPSGIVVVADTAVSSRQFRLPVTINLLYRPADRSANGAVRFHGLQPPSLIEAFDAPLMLAGFDFPVSGSVGFSMSESGGLQPLRIDVAGGQGTFDLEGHFEAPLPVSGFEFRGILDPGSQSLAVEKLTYDSGVFEAHASGQIAVEKDGPSVHLEIRSDAVPLDQVTDFWPTDHGRLVRSWLVDHVRGGNASDIVAALNIEPEMWRMKYPPDSAFRISFGFTDGDIQFSDKFDPLTGAEGRLAVTGRSLAVEVGSAESGMLRLAEGNVHIRDFAAQPLYLEASFRSKGSIAESVEAVLRGPIAAAVPAAEEALGIGGNADVAMTLKIPLDNRPAFEHAEFTAKASLANVVADGLFNGLPLRAEKLALEVDREKAALSGDILLGGSSLNVHWDEIFSEQPHYPRQIAFSGRILMGDLDAAGVGPGELATGTADVQGRLRFEAGDVFEARVEADLEKVRLAVPDLGWSKASGVEGRAEVTARRDAAKMLTLEKLKVAAPDLTLSGDVVIDPSGSLASARFERADLGLSLMSLVLRPAPDGTMDIQAAGEAFDLRPFRQRMLEQGGARTDILDGAHVSFELRRLIIGDETELQTATGDLRLGGALPTGTVSGLLNGVAPLEIVVAPAEGGSDFSITSDDGGAVLQALGLGNAIRKGRLTSAGRASDDGAFSGLTTMDDFTLTETPAFARLLSLASFTGIGEALSGRGLSFSRAEFPFKYADGRLDIPSGRMAGPSVGLTTAGYYLYDSDELRFVGNLIPAYSLSQVLGQIPLLGTILGGDQGLFGVTYEIVGTSAAPVVKVNPLSALAPGILRRMFLEPVDEKSVQTPQTENPAEQR